MDLGPEERYAVAALWTLALHDTAVAGWAAASRESKEAPWGEPQGAEEEADGGQQAGQARPSLTAAHWEAYWGWDCVAPGGLCECMYAHLRIPPTSWLGLKRLPLVGAQGDDRVPLEVVRSFAHIIDPHLAAALPAPAPSRRRQGAPAAEGGPAGAGAGTGAAAGRGAVTHITHTGYLPSVDDMLLLGEVPAHSAGQDAGHPDLAHPSGLASPEGAGAGGAGGSSLEGTPTAAPRAVRDDLFDGLLSSSDDSDWESDMHREHHPAPATPPAGAGAGAADGGTATCCQPPQEVPGAAVASPATCVTDPCPAHGSQCQPPQQEGQQQAQHQPEQPQGQSTACQGPQPLQQQPAVSHPLLAMPGEASEDSGSPRSQAGTTASDAEGEEELRQAGAAAAEGVASSSSSRAPQGAKISAPAISAHALGALWELVQGCVGAHMPPDSAAAATNGHLPERRAAAAVARAGSSSAPSTRPGDAQTQGSAAPTSSGGEGGEPAGEGAGGEGEVCQQLPRVRWYDARARVALKQVAMWLQVPWAKVANFELLLANQKAPSAAAADQASAAAAAKGSESVWDQRLRWLSVGAAAVGGGALFAVTGGLAAPALAAGLAPVISLVGGSSAVAGAVSGFLGSTTGAITLASTLGAAGATSTGSKMAYRTAGVSEFGFQELRGGGEGASTGADGGGPAAAGASGSGRGEAGAAREGEGGVRGGEGQGVGVDPSMGRELQRLPSSHSTASLESSDSGHLLAPTRASLATAGSARPRPPSRPPSRLPSSAQLHASRSAGSLASPAGGGGGASGGEPSSDAAPASAPAPAPSEPSAWQRWFGKKEEEAPLLPVPLRVRGAGDVKLSALVCISGWITNPRDYVTQWEGIRAADTDTFSLVWESRELLALNSALGVLVAKQAASQGAQYAVQHFFFAGAGLLSAIAPALLLDTATGLLIENAWAVATERAQKAGKLLARILMAGGDGGRPVTLVAHSMGARLAFHCLLELCRNDCRGVVQDVVLLGTPVSTRPERWRMARRAVAGRLVNAYSRRDWLLGVVFGGASGFVKAAAGLCPVEGVAGVENANLTSLVGGHFDYIGQLADVLDSLALLA